MRSGRTIAAGIVRLTSAATVATSESEADSMSLRDRDRDLFHHLVGGAVRGAAVGRAQPAGRAGRSHPAPIPARRRSRTLKRKLVWTTIVAGVVFALWYVVYTYRLIALDDLAALLGVAPR